MPLRGDGLEGLPAIHAAMSTATSTTAAASSLDRIIGTHISAKEFLPGAVAAARQPAEHVEQQHVRELQPLRSP